jgi:hypothetical protein
MKNEIWLTHFNTLVCSISKCFIEDHDIRVHEIPVKISNNFSKIIQLGLVNTITVDYEEYCRLLNFLRESDKNILYIHFQYDSNENVKRITRFRNCCFFVPEQSFEENIDVKKQFFKVWVKAETLEVLYEKSDETFSIADGNIKIGNIQAASVNILN